MTQQAAQFLMLMVLSQQPMRYEKGAAFKRHFDALLKAGLIMAWDGPDPEGGTGIVKVCKATDAGISHVVKALGAVVAAYKPE